MTDGRYILNVLKESGTSKFIRNLTPDALVPNINKAIEIIEQEGGQKSEDLKKSVFHTPRIVSNGSHFAFTIPEKRPYYRPLIKSSVGHADLNLKMDDKLEQLLTSEKFHYDAAKGIFPYSMAYAGFQFGQFAGQLGDGRVVNLFDIKDSDGKWQTLQLKGSGLTPFSRFADGKAVVKSSIREFIISEALYQIGIPSTRALQLTFLPKTKATRGMSREPTAVVCRMAPCWMRLGSFDLFRWKPNLKGLLKLSNFVIDEVFDQSKDFPNTLDVNVFKNDFFPDDGVEPRKIGSVDGITKYDSLFRQVVNKNAECVAYWQSYGFMNGVLNTDNTSIMGISMDYGPFNFLDKFQPGFTPNHDDLEGRYSFENQPSVIWWNLIQFAEAIAILIGAGEKHIGKITSLQETMEPLPKDIEQSVVERANNIINLGANEYKYTFTTKYAEIMSNRLGVNLDIKTSSEDCPQVKATSVVVKDFCSTIIEPLLEILRVTQIDYNNFFVNLQNFTGPFFTEKTAVNGLNKGFISIFFNEKQLQKLQAYYDTEERSTASDSGETRILTETFEKLTNWAKVYSGLVSTDQERHAIAKKYNPLFTPRSWIFDQVVDDLIDKQRAELNEPHTELDISLLKKLHLMSTYPYDRTKWDRTLRPEVEDKWANVEHSDESEKFMKKASCSS